MHPSESVVKSFFFFCFSSPNELTCADAIGSRFMISRRVREGPVLTCYENLCKLLEILLMSNPLNSKSPDIKLEDTVFEIRVMKETPILSPGSIRQG